jgi:hypothetical protein
MRTYIAPVKGSLEEFSVLAFLRVKTLAMKKKMALA